MVFVMEPSGVGQWRDLSMLSVERWRMLEGRGEYYRRKLAFLTVSTVGSLGRIAQ